MDVVLATCAEFRGLDPDEPLLVAALADRGIAARSLAWDDPDALWDADLTVLRSTWNYHHRPAEFVAWVERVAATGRVLNPAPVVRWNAHKRYLEDLAARGAAVVPTTYVRRGTPTDLAALLTASGLDEAVVKPAVSASAFATKRVRRDEVAAQQSWFAALLAERDVMVQPFVASVDGHGERALVFIDGEPSHAVRKSSFSTGHAGTTGPFEMEADELALARLVLSGIDADLLYARVDVARDASGVPMLMELELIEPSLYLRHCPAAAARLADAIARRLVE